MISAPVSGRLGRIALKNGDSLNAGDIIARLTPMPSDLRTIRTNQAVLHGAEAQRRAAESALERAQSIRSQARRDHDRIEKLAANGIASAHELEQSRLAQSNAEKAYESALFASQAAAFEAEEAQAALLSADPGDPSQDALISQIPIRSPVRGRVLHVLEKSERVVQAGDSLVELADAGALELVFETLSTDAVRIPAGAPVLVEQWGGEGILQASIRTIEPSAFTKVSALGVEEQRVNVIARLNNTQDLLGDGYRVEGRIVVWTESNVIKVPISALFKKNESWSVFVVSNGVAVSRPVRIGHRNDSEAEVLSGLVKDELVILYPSDRIADGVAVSLHSS
jgi:HlyD family secretion protein